MNRTSPAPEARLTRAAVEVLESMGAKVVLDADGETLTRLARDNDAPATAVVEAEGLPNLLHELCHVLQAGRLDDDHGIDYGAIPFDLEQPAGRQILWDELACCVVSCGYLRGPAAVADAWFVEQVEFQPVFYGYEGDPGSLWRAIDGLLLRRGDEAERVVARTRVLMSEALANVDREISDPLTRSTLSVMWGRNRDRLPGDGDGAG